MNTNETYIVRPKNMKEAKMVRSLLKAVEVAFDVNKTKSPYNPEFVRKIKKAEKETPIRVNKDGFKQLIGYEE